MNKNVDELMVEHLIHSGMLMEVFSEPVTFNKAYVAICDSALEALFLSYATYAAEQAPQENEGWFTKTIEEWQAETGMTRSEQTRARKKLREKGFLIERHVGMPRMLYFKVDVQNIILAIDKHARSKWGCDEH